MDTSATALGAPRADAFMRRVLRVPTAPADGRAERIFGASLLVSTVRCLLTYVVLPVLKPVVDLTGGVGPVLGLLLAVVSTAAIVASMRRFWAADHRYRWHYTLVGGAILAFLAVGAVVDIANLL